MKRIRLRSIVFYCIVIVLSVINYESDLIKFLFSGYSSTYDVVMIRHSYFIVMPLAILFVIFSIARKFRNEIWIRYGMIVALVFWVLSMRTAAYVSTDSTLASGWSFVKIYSCKCLIDGEKAESVSAVANCEIALDPVLDRKLRDKLN